MLVERATPGDSRPRLRSYSAGPGERFEEVDHLLGALGGREALVARVGRLWVVDGGSREPCDRARVRLSEALAPDLTVEDGNILVGHHASAAAAIIGLFAAAFLTKPPTFPLERNILVVSLGEDLRAVELLAPAATERRGEQPED